MAVKKQSFMKYIHIIFLFLISINNLKAQELIQNNLQTTVSFKIKNLGTYVNGTFSNTTITSNFDTKNIENSFLNAIINVKTIDTNNTKRNKHLLETTYFDVSNYPSISLKSSSIKHVSENNYTLKAKLTVKATTKEITIPLIISTNKNENIIVSNFEINRRDFKVGKNSWVMSDTVLIKVKYVATK